MEERRLTKEDIDKVRDIEGFPIAKDEDIIALSRPPYYSACPNPFIEDFIKENGIPYDEATDDYHGEPFAADVSEGKNDPIYNAHSYHTKVPFKAIMRYILHYTSPGDIVFDGFSGTGMTGVAAQMCANNTADYRYQLQNEMPYIQWGARKAILCDLSPTAAFISHNYNANTNIQQFVDNARQMLADCEREWGWMYDTYHSANGQPAIGIDGKPITGKINYYVWSDVLVCPSCSKELVFWDAAVDAQHGKVRDVFACPHCGSNISKKDCDRAFETKYDSLLKQTISMAKQTPVMINYTYAGKRYEKKPDAHDLKLLKKIEDLEYPYWIPSDRMPEGGETRRNDRFGITHVHHFFTKANAIVLSYIAAHAKDNQTLCLVSDIIPRASKMHKIAVSRLNTNLSKTAGVLSGTLYIPSNSIAYSAMYMFESRINDVANAMGHFNAHTPVLITNQSTADLRNIPDNSIDYIFTDPPFGSNLNYSELNFITESWLKIVTNNKSEAIINPNQNKSAAFYQDMMTKCFMEYYRLLKPGRWMTVEFHNSKNSVWNSIQEGLSCAGFVVADVRTLDKKQTSFKQVTSASAVKQDLVISAYKPKQSFIREFEKRAGDPEMAWEFVRQHLSHVPVAPDSTGKIEIVQERQDYLLFDRMVAFHIMNGIPIPMDSSTFYAGLKERFIERDGMYFLPDQVNEYDQRRTTMELQDVQLSFLISDEKTAIQWLNYQLSTRQTYSELQPKYLQDVHQDKFEQMPELLDMLKENFLQDENGKWYIPDLSNKADLEKLRRKSLLKDFYNTYAVGKGRIKNARTEAIRAGFDECWKERNYQMIVDVGNRLPETILQEDPALLMYYDNASNRV